MNRTAVSLLSSVIFKNVLNDCVIKAFIGALNELEKGSLEKILKSYSFFISLLYEREENQNIYNYLKFLLYTDENILSKNQKINNYSTVLDTAAYELSLLDNLLKHDYYFFKASLEGRFPDNMDIIKHLPKFYTESRMTFSLDDIIKSYKTNGFGIYACYNAFKFTEDKEILPVRSFEKISFSMLKNYEYQKKVLYDNTKAFLEGKEACSILLYGDRGCGKSSSVKALINEFSAYNLKIIQVTKESFKYLADLYEKIRVLPLKFIIFADDISFEEDDDNFSEIKSALEGSLCRKPENVLIYAASNRIHLIKENFSSREGDEVHLNDTIDETASLSDRFGIVLAFSLLTKNEYLDIVKKIAEDYGINADSSMLQKAEQFAALKGIRTPRTARQFIACFNTGADI